MVYKKGIHMSCLIIDNRKDTTWRLPHRRISYLLEVCTLIFLLLTNSYVFIDARFFFFFFKFFYLYHFIYNTKYI